MIQFHPESVHQSRSGTITGIVFVQHEDGSCFPCELWNDFVVVLANWWTDAANSLKFGGNQVRLQFMDGPYWMDITKDGDIVRITCVDDHTPRKYPITFDYDFLKLERDITRFAIGVWQNCKERKMVSEDVRTLGGKLGMHE